MNTRLLFQQATREPRLNNDDNVTGTVQNAQLYCSEPNSSVKTADRAPINYYRRSQLENAWSILANYRQDPYSTPPNYR